MKIPSNHLEAFYTVAQTRNFSRAADLLHVTQSALSQRVQKLEDELALTLFIRQPSGLLLTPAGERLLRYCQTNASLEEELLGDLKSKKGPGELSGALRLATYSSIFRSSVLPALTPFLQKNPKIDCEFEITDVHNLYDLLQSGRVDFIIIDSRIEREGLEGQLLGHEEYVMIESREHTTPEDRYLDNDATDTATEIFFRAQGQPPPKYRRAYMGDCYGIIDAVASGLGRAVMPKHLVQKRKDLKIIKGHKPVLFPVHLYWYSQPFYSRLHQTALNILKSHAIPNTSQRKTSYNLLY